MSNMTTVRDLAMVTSDIQYAQRQGARQLASNLIEIGRLLVEAKNMVEPKDWEKYIWDNFGYSTSSADNWMKLYKEYGNDQESLFDSFTNSQTFGRMSYTKLLALTAIPAEEREEFVEQHDVENMSTRQLQQVIRERDEARKALAEAEEKIDDLEGDLEDSHAGFQAMKDERQLAESEAKELRKQITAAQKAKADAEAAQSTAARELEKVKKQLADAQAREEAARADLKKAQENPSIPDSVMEQMRAEVEADAAQRATADIQKQLASAQQQAADAAKAREAAETAARDAEAKLVAAQKASKLAHPDVMAVNVLAQKMLKDWDVILAHRASAVADDPNNTAPIDAFLNKMLDTMCGSIVAP